MRSTMVITRFTYRISKVNVDGVLRRLGRRWMHGEQPVMSAPADVRLTWPWPFSGLILAFLGMRLSGEVTGSVWVGYAAFVLTLVATQLLFAWLKSRRPGQRTRTRD